MVDSSLCTGCATCAGVCPNNALKMEMMHEGRYIPKIASNNCKECYLCTRVCPASNENFRELNRFIFNRMPDDKFIGNFINCYKGYSANSAIRWSATSGGLITSLLLFLLKNQLIDGALLTRIDKDNPLRAEPFVARTEEEILSAMGSKYVPVPLNQLLSQILSEDGKFAVVGLPCHLQGIRRAELKIPDLGDKIAYHFGIVCSHTVSFLGIEYILNKMGIASNKIAELKYRGDGWPGGIRVLQKNGQQKFLPMLGTWWSEMFGGFFFSHHYCTLCNDPLNEMSDISFADAFFPETMKSDKVGTSIVITRTHRGEKLIKATASRNEIEVFALTPEDVIQSQLFTIVFKKRNLKARIKFLKIFAKSIPRNLKENVDTFLNPTLWDYIVAPITYINIFISKNVFLKHIFEHLPLRILAFYRQGFKRMILYHASETVKQSKEGIKAVPGNTTKIVITNSHANNRGDEAAQRSMINSFQTLMPNAKLTVLTTSPDGLELQENVSVLRTFSASKKMGPFIILWTVLKSLGIRLPTFGKKREIFEALEEMADADVVISSPGGPYFGDLYRSHEIQEHLFHIFLSKILRKPVMIYGPAMGPFKSRWRKIIRKHILNKTEIITLRDYISKEYLDNLNLTHPLIYLTADSAFQNIINLDRNEIRNIMVKEKIIDFQSEDMNKKPLIGITPVGREWNYRDSVNPLKEQNRYNKIIARTIDYLIDKFDATIIFFPQLYGNSDDMPLINEIIRMVDKKDSVRVFSGKWNSEIQQAIISQMDIFIGNRYHSVIFALKARVPVICLAYEHKVIGLMDTVKLNRYVVKIDDLTYESLIDKINQVWRERKLIRNVLKPKIDIMRRHSLVNSILANALVNCTIRGNTRQKELEEEIDKLMTDFQQGKLPLCFDRR